MAADHRGYSAGGELRVFMLPYPNNCPARSAELAISVLVALAVTAIFVLQKLSLTLAGRICSGQPCQKQPSRKTATLARVKVRSAGGAARGPAGNSPGNATPGRGPLSGAPAGMLRSECPGTAWDGVARLPHLFAARTGEPPRIWECHHTGGSPVPSCNGVRRHRSARLIPHQACRGLMPPQSLLTSNSPQRADLANVAAVPDTPLPYNPLDRVELGKSVERALLSRELVPLPPAVRFPGAGFTRCTTSVTSSRTGLSHLLRVRPGTFRST